MTARKCETGTKALEDGHLSDDEVAHLNHIASTVGETISSFARRFFKKQGESFVRGLFLAALEDGAVTQEEWNNLVTSSERLGLKGNELQKLIARPAQQHIEHVLADAKSDGAISDEEEQELARLMDMFQTKEELRGYVSEEIRFLRAREEILEGILPSISAPDGIALKSGEIVHGCCNGVLVVVKSLKDGPQQVRHSGTFIVLDSRAVFQSISFSQVITYPRLVATSIQDGHTCFQLNGKPVWGFVHDDEQPLFPLIFTQAVALANQLIVRKQTEGGPSRHIPRAVRQRVWQRYGGKCVECDAADYLEFDHIIPVAKGGSNSESNIQLLCRRCNLKKSDRI